MGEPAIFQLSLGKHIGIGFKFSWGWYFGIDIHFLCLAAQITLVKDSKQDLFTFVNYFKE